jgi:KDO2-lipid IV(A) lauroyltransferase
MPNDLTILAGLARLSLPMRRRALRLIWSAGRLYRPQRVEGLRAVLQFAIRVSNAEGARLEAEIHFHDLMATLEWGAVLSRSKAALSRDLASIVIENESLLADLAATRKPIILAPLHMGCYALPFAKMMRDHFADRPMLILRAREDRVEETEAMRRISEIGVDMRFLNVADKQAYMDGVRFARAGAVIVTFVDLPASYGGAVSETLFGRPAQLAMGINSLARVTGADVVPLAVHSSITGDVVRLGRPFESFETGPAEKVRVAGLVRRHIEQSVLAAPEQWHMWARLDEFYAPATHREAA